MGDDGRPGAPGRPGAEVCLQIILLYTIFI
jgi:hypothetical protein